MAKNTITAALVEARNNLADRRNDINSNIERLASNQNFIAIPEFVTKINLLDAEIGAMNSAITIASSMEDKV